MSLGLPFGLLLVGLFGSRRDLTTRAKPVSRTPVRTTVRRARARPTTRRTTAAPAPAPRRTTAAPAAAPRTPAPTAAPAPKVVPVSTTTAVRVQPAPWPQVVPAGLPGFPGARWVPDDPPGAGVVARAQQLLSTLWTHGAGTFKTEQTAGRWITYRATPMGSKKGVVAFKLLPGTPAPTPKAAPAPSSMPQVVPAATRAVAKPSAMALPTLRLTSPRTKNASVKVLQQKLGITADGVFGSGTHRSVIAYQRAHGLVPDGVVGRKTWASLFGSQA
jgi:peptidoglycan hydrolase-like protein with peptidoglycan-binding domain